jgi:GcrA cell cycle regulator
MPIFWTERRTTVLKNLWAGGLSYDEIAGILDVTRGAIAGKAHRLGLPPRREPKTPKRPPPRPDFIGIGFFETTAKTCMYPEGDGAGMLFCGQPRQDGSSYCAAHHQLCWVKPTGKSNRQAFTGAWGRVA